jgi:cytidyltransferase-like protein
MQIIAVYPGRFHPFHKGHFSSFKELANKFGKENTYLALSAKQEQPKHPFSALDRAKMAMVLGIPRQNILVVNTPYMAREYIEKFEKQGLDPNNTVLVFGVSKKDMEGVPELNIPPDPRFTFEPKKDGSPSYLQPFNQKDVKPMTQHAYVISTNVEEFPILGKVIRDASKIRQMYQIAKEGEKLQILQDLYGKYAEVIKPIFDQNLTQSLSEIKVLPVTPIATNMQTKQEPKQNVRVPSGKKPKTPDNPDFVVKLQSLQKKLEEAESLLNKAKKAVKHKQNMDKNLNEGLTDFIPDSTKKIILAMCTASGLSACMTTNDLRSVQTLGRVVNTIHQDSKIGITPLDHARNEMKQELYNYIRAKQGDPGAQNQSRLYRQEQQSQPKIRQEPTIPRVNTRESKKISKLDYIDEK